MRVDDVSHRRIGTDEMSTPPLLYHGTKATFTRFSRNWVGDPENEPGFFFFEDEGPCTEYAGDGGFILAVKASVSNILEQSAEE